MSFSTGIKDEISRVSIKHEHCTKAELCGIIYSAGTLSFTRHGFSLTVTTEHKPTAINALSLFKKVIGLECELSEVIRQPKNTTAYQVRADSLSVDTLSALGLSLGAGIDIDKESFAGIVGRECCKTAFIRGAFLGSGSMTDPNNSYHLEIVMHNNSLAEALLDVLRELGIEAGITEKKNSTVVYIKDIETLIQFLGKAGASGSVLELENIRILKSIKNTINRQTNWDNANIEKTLNASEEQVANISRIINTIGLGKLSPTLRKTALLRLENPEATLSELAALSGDTTRSGINHRLRRLNNIALSLSEQEGGKYDN